MRGPQGPPSCLSRIPELFGIEAFLGVRLDLYHPALQLPRGSEQLVWTTLNSAMSGIWSVGASCPSGASFQRDHLRVLLKARVWGLGDMTEEEAGVGRAVSSPQSWDLHFQGNEAIPLLLTYCHSVWCFQSWVHYSHFRGRSVYIHY